MAIYREENNLSSDREDEINKCKHIGVQKRRGGGSPCPPPLPLFLGFSVKNLTRNAFRVLPPSGLSLYAPERTDWPF